jgi:hypothetical protein
MFLSLKTTSRGIDRVINKLYVSNFVSVLSSKMYSSMQHYLMLDTIISVRLIAQFDKRNRLVWLNKFQMRKLLTASARIEAAVSHFRRLRLGNCLTIVGVS